jgi:putative flavoprotein involved in K+ transport
MSVRVDQEQVDTVVIGGGQAGLSVGYHLKRLGQQFVILDANERVGDSWRNRWDSLRLFTPAKYSGLNGMPVPRPGNSMITKDEMADYLESYAREFDLPVRNGARVESLSRSGDRFEIRAGSRCIVANQVVVAMGNYQVPRVPRLASRLDPRIVQLHSMEYRNPGQLREGGVLIVGAGNSGAEIARDIAAHHKTWVAGRDVGQIPFRVESPLGLNVLAPFVLRGLFHRVLTVRTPMGRRMRPKVLTQGGPLIRVKRKELARLGVERVGRVIDVQDGKPVVEGGAVLEASNVIWCTGFEPGFSWIHLPVLGPLEPNHKRGVVESEPGLYFVGLEFLYSMSSEMIHGVGRDARYIAGRVAERNAATTERQLAGATNAV